MKLLRNALKNGDDPKDCVMLSGVQAKSAGKRQTYLLFFPLLQVLITFYITSLQNVH